MYIRILVDSFLKFSLLERKLRMNQSNVHFFTLMNSRTLLVSLRSTIEIFHHNEKRATFLPVNK